MCFSVTMPASESTTGVSTRQWLSGIYQRRVSSSQSRQCQQVRVRLRCPRTCGPHSSGSRRQRQKFHRLPKGFPPLVTRAVRGDSHAQQGGEGIHSSKGVGFG